MAVSICNFAKALGHRAYLLFLGGIAGFWWIAEQLIGKPLSMPGWLLFLAVFGSLLVAAFWAFHDLRVEKDSLLEEKNRRIAQLETERDTAHHQIPNEQEAKRKLELVEAELALAREEAAHAKALLAHTDPVTTAMVKTRWADWRAKMVAYLSVAISRGAGARFNPIGREETVMALGEPIAANLDIGADIKLLDDLLSEVRSVAIEASQEALEKAARARCENEAALLFRNPDQPIQGGTT